MLQENPIEKLGQEYQLSMLSESGKAEIPSSVLIMSAISSFCSRLQALPVSEFDAAPIATAAMFLATGFKSWDCGVKFCVVRRLHAELIQQRLQLALLVSASAFRCLFRRTRTVGAIRTFQKTVNLISYTLQRLQGWLHTQ